MSFQAPLVLIGLVALPLLAFWYAGRQRERRAAAAAFASPVMQASVVTRRPRWRRHAPMLVFAIALAALIVAAARPQRTVAVPVERASIVLATDVSGSMTATDVQPNRLVAAKRAARRFVMGVPAKVNVGVVAFNGTSRVLQSPSHDREAVSAAIDNMTPSGGTATGDAIATSVQLIRQAPAQGGKRPPGAIVLLSDGSSTTGRDPVAAARQAKQLGIRVYTVALGTQQGTIQVPRRGGGTQTVRVPPDPAALAQIARASGGKAYTAATAGGLKDVYEQLGSQLGHKKEKRQVTAAFAGGAMVLLLAGGAMSLAWFGRLV